MCCLFPRARFACSGRAGISAGIGSGTPPVAQPAPAWCGGVCGVRAGRGLPLCSHRSPNSSGGSIRSELAAACALAENSAGSSVAGTPGDPAANSAGCFRPGSAADSRAGLCASSCPSAAGRPCAGSCKVPKRLPAASSMPAKNFMPVVGWCRPICKRPGFAGSDLRCRPW